MTWRECWTIKAQVGNGLRLLFAKQTPRWQEAHHRMSSTHHIDINNVATLARLALTDEEAACYRAQLDGILAYIDMLTDCDMDSVDTTAHAMPVFDVLRPDNPRASFDKVEALHNAPKQSGGQFQIPKVIE